MGCFHLVYNLIPRFLRLTSFGTSSQRSRNEVRWVGIGRNRIVGIHERNSTQGAADRATTKGVSSNRRSAADGCPPGVRQSWAIATGRLCKRGSKTRAFVARGITWRSFWFSSFRPGYEVRDFSITPPSNIPARATLRLPRVGAPKADKAPKPIRAWVGRDIAPGRA